MKQRGKRIRPSGKDLVFHFTIASLLPVFLLVVGLFHVKTIQQINWQDFNLSQADKIDIPYLIISFSVAILICLLVAFVFKRVRYDTVKQLYHRQKLAKMILENKWYESEQVKTEGFFKDSAGRTKEKITYFPKMYYRLKNGLIQIRVEITLGKYQDQLLHLEKKLESGLYCELTDKELKDSYVEYTLLYDTIASRISIDEVEAKDGKLRLMKNVWWEYDKLPHMLIAGGTGGGKTYFILTLIEALLHTDSKLYILDPKNADLADLGSVMANTGLIKRETTKAIHAIMNFVLVFILSASFIAYAPDYIKKINDFSSDISNASLSLGTKIVMPHSDSQGKDSVDLIRDSLFSIQVQQPWLLLQYNSSDIESIGIDRVESLLSTSPDSNNGEDREKIVAEEIEDRSNTNLTITKTINRLGTVFFLFVFNIGISIFVFLLTGIMIFSQVLFIIYAMFLPVSFILSMIPSFDGMSKRAITKLFNTILTRAGITLIITTAFSISTMLYTLSAGYPFFLIAFLQIVTFAGIYFKLGDLMSMFSLQSNDSQSVGSRVMRKPRMLMHAHMHRLQRKLGRSMTTLGAGSAIVTGKKGQSGSGSSARTQADHSRPDGKEKSTLGKRIGQTIGTVADTKDRMVDTASGLKEQVKDLPTNARYGKAGINLPRTAQQQYDVTQHIPLSEAQAGDLVFFHSTYNAGSYITHVGIYLGNNRMFHAGDPIGYADLTSPYWQQHLVGAGRIKQ